MSAPDLLNLEVNKNSSAAALTTHAYNNESNLSDSIRRIKHEIEEKDVTNCLDDDESVEGAGFVES